MDSPPRPRKRAYNGRFKTPRSRSGCTQCRQRRVKCDEQKPSCKRCLNGEFCCIYEKPLSWPDEPRGVSKPRGVTRPSPTIRQASVEPQCEEVVFISESPKDCSSSGWLNPFVDTLLADFDALSSPGTTTTNTSFQDTDEDMSSSVVPGLFDSSLSLLRPSTIYPAGQDTSPFTKQLFDFYLHRMCLRCILLDKDSHSYRKVVVPIALQSTLVFNALLALAASQMLPYQHDPSYKQKTLQYQGYSLRTLAQRISRLDEGGSSESEILAAILMLCLLEVMHNTFRRGMEDSIDMEVHAFGAQRVLESPTFDGKKPHNVEMSSFLGQMLSARYLLQFTSTLDPVDAEGRARYWMGKTTRPEREVNCFAGCSNELLSLLCDVVSAVRQHGANHFAEDDLGMLRTGLEGRVQQIEQQELLRQDEFSANAVISSEANRFLLIAEAYRLVAIVLIEQYLQPPGQPTNYQLIQEHVLAVLSDSCMRSAFSIPPPGKACRSSPLWPVFIASCQVRGDATRAEAASWFVQIMAQDETTSDILGPMLEVIESVWERQGACELDDGVWRFPWEEVLVSKGWELCWA